MNSEEKNSNPPLDPSAQRIDLPIREIKQLFESFKGIRISNRLAYQIQESLIRGEGEQVGPTLEVDGVKVRFAINGLPGLTSLRKILLYRSLMKSRKPDGTIDLGHAAEFLQMKKKGILDPVDRLRRRLILEEIDLAPDGKEIRIKGGLTFEELSFDFDAPAEGLDLAEFGRKLLIAVYEFHDCSIGETSRFFHTGEQMMFGILKRAGIEFEIPDSLDHFQLPQHLENQFGPVVSKEILRRLRIPMAEILRTAKVRAGKKKIANRRFLDEMEMRVKNFINLVLATEFGEAILNEENAASLHAAAWHFVQWEISQLPVEDILNLGIVSPYEMMFARSVRHLHLTPNGAPAFFNKDFNLKVLKPYSPIIFTYENFELLFRLFKTADLLETSFHETLIPETHVDADADPNQSLLEIELKHLQRFPVEIRPEEIRQRLTKVLDRVGKLSDLYGILAVEFKQVLAALQEILELPFTHFFGVKVEKKDAVFALLRQTILKIQPYLKNHQDIHKDFSAICKAYVSALEAYQEFCKAYLDLCEPNRRMVNTWASLSELYRLIHGTKGLDAPGSRKHRAKAMPSASPQEPESEDDTDEFQVEPPTAPHDFSQFPIVRFGPELNELPLEKLVRATFVFPTNAFTKLNLIPPHLRAFFIIDRPDNHVGQYHMAAWGFRIHWKRRRLGLGQKQVADDYIRSLRFLRCFAYRKDKKSPPLLAICNVDNETFGQAKYSGGGTILERAKMIALKVLNVPDSHIVEITQAEEPANTLDKITFFLKKLDLHQNPV